MPREGYQDVCRMVGEVITMVTFEHSHEESIEMNRLV